MASTRISVILPSLNRGAYLERAICSVLDQDGPEVELLVADGGSTDGSAQTIERYADDLAWVRIGPDGGPANAINLALEQASGDVVTVLWASAVLLPGALREAAARMQKGRTGGSPWCIGRVRKHGPSDQEVGPVHVAHPSSLASFLRHDSGLLPLPGSFYRREIFDRHRGFDTEFRWSYAYEFHCRLLAANITPTLLDAPLTAVREEGGDGPGVHQTLQTGLEHIAAAERYANAIPIQERPRLWRNCDERRRIYTLAAAESRESESRRLLWQHLLRRPWWVANDHYRHALLKGVKPVLPAAA